MQPGTQLAVLAGIALALIAAGVWIALRVTKRNPEKREKRRRLHVNQVGRLGDALITEAADALIYYSYSVNGVEYSASQDISALRELLPAEPGRLVGVAHLKYSPKNPANSILICEEWNGLRAKGASSLPASPSLPSSTSLPA
jgi:hypothetical protein